MVADDGADMGGIGGRSGDVGTEMGNIDGDRADSDETTLQSLGYTVDDGTGPDGMEGDSTNSEISTLTLVLYVVVFLVALVLLMSLFI